MRVSRVPLVVLVFLAACIDNRAAEARKDLETRVSGESGGALTLTSFEKTNTTTQTIPGFNVQMYTVEWEARLAVNRDIWKGGNGIEGYWSSFGVMAVQPDMWGNLMSGGAAKEIVKGATVVLSGATMFQKMDGRWGGMNHEVKGSKVLNNQRSPEAIAELQRRQDSLEQVRQAAELAEQQRQVALADEAARVAAEEKRLKDEMIAAARTNLEVLGSDECIYRSQGSARNFPRMEFRTYRFVATGSMVTRELVKLETSTGPAWSNAPNGDRDTVWFDELRVKPGYYRGSGSTLDRTIPLKRNNKPDLDLYCSGEEVAGRSSRVPPDHLGNFFKVLEGALDSWKAKNATLVPW